MVIHCKVENIVKSKQIDKETAEAQILAHHMKITEEQAKERLGKKSLIKFLCKLREEKEASISKI